MAIPCRDERDPNDQQVLSQHDVDLLIYKEELLYRVGSRRDHTVSTFCALPSPFVKSDVRWEIPHSSAWKGQRVWRLQPMNVCSPLFPSDWDCLPSVGRLCLGSSSCLQDGSCQCSLATLQTLTSETWSFLHVLIPSNMEASFTYLGTSFTYLGTISSLLHSSFFSYFGQHPPTSFQIV